VDGEELRSGAAQRLTRAEFADASDLLREIGRTKNATVRLNLIVAWAELIRRSDDAELRKEATERLVGVVLETEDDESGQQLIDCAAQELLEIDDEASINQAMTTVRAAMGLRSSTAHFSRATRLASALIRRRLGRGGTRLSLGAMSYAAQWRLALSQWAFSLRDSLPVLIIAVAFGAVVPLSIANLGSRYGLSVDVGNAVVLFSIGTLVIALIAQAVAVPAAALIKPSRPMEALNQLVMCIGALLFMKLALSLDLTQVTFGEAVATSGEAAAGRGGPAPAPEEPGPGIWPYLWWIALGVFTSRWTATTLSSLGRSLLLAGAAGCVLGVLLAVSVAVWSRTASGNGGWIVLVLVIAASAIGSNWADHRRGGKIVADEQSRLRQWPASAIVLLGGIVFIAVAFSSADSKLQQAQQIPQSRIQSIGCGDSGSSIVSIELATTYRLRPCADVFWYLHVLEPTVPLPRPANGGGPTPATFPIDTVLNTFDRESNPLDRADDPPTIRLSGERRFMTSLFCVEVFGQDRGCVPPTRGTATLSELLTAFADAWRGAATEEFFSNELNEENDSTPLSDAERQVLRALRICVLSSRNRNLNAEQACKAV
jgi:hypothetical protein